MSGHSKWHSIKHKKGAADAKRGKLFTRIIKELTVAARDGGGDPDCNPRLRTVIADAKAGNMPADNIKRAIRRGTGEEPGVSYDEVTYEGYGPGGVALLLEVLTDNKNRAVGEIRHLLTKHGGNLGSTNSVAWMFDKRGYILVEKEGADEEALMTAAIDAARRRLPRRGRKLGRSSARPRRLTRWPRRSGRSGSSRRRLRSRCCLRTTSRSRGSRPSSC